MKLYDGRTLTLPYKEHYLPSGQYVGRSVMFELLVKRLIEDDVIELDLSNDLLLLNNIESLAEVLKGSILVQKITFPIEIKAIQRWNTGEELAKQSVELFSEINKTIHRNKSL